MPRDWRHRLEDILEAIDKIERHTEVPWDEMRGIRNVTVHEYFGISLALL